MIKSGLEDVGMPDEDDEFDGGCGDGKSWWYGEPAGAYQCQDGLY